MDQPLHLGPGVPVAGMDGLVVGYPQRAQRGHAHEEHAAGPEHARELGDGGAVVRDPAVIEDVERGHAVEGRVRERKREQAALGRGDAADPAVVEGVVGEVDPHRAAEAREMTEVVAGPAAGVEDPRLPRPGRERRPQQRHADRAHAGVPPLRLLGVEHPAVLFGIHRSDR